MPRAGDNIILFSPLRIRTLTGHDPVNPRCPGASGEKHRESDTVLLPGLPPLARAKGPGRADVTYQRLQRSVFVEGAEDPAPTKLASRVSGELEGSLGEWSRVLSSYRTGSHTHSVSIPARGVGMCDHGFTPEDE